MTNEEQKGTAHATYLAIGRFIFEFSQLEYALRFYVAQEANISDKHFEAIMTHDFALLCTSAEEILGPGFTNEDGEKRFRQFIKSCKKLNNERVRVAHGLWVPFKEGGTVHHTSRSSLKSTMSQEQGKNLEEQADIAQGLRSDLENLIWNDAFGWESTR